MQTQHSPELGIDIAMQVLQKFILDRTLNGIQGIEDEHERASGVSNPMSTADHENMLHKMLEAQKNPYQLTDFAALFFSRSQISQLVSLAHNPEAFCEALDKMTLHNEPHHYERLVLALTLSLRYKNREHRAKEHLTGVYANWPSAKLRFPPGMLSDAVLMLDAFRDQSNLDTTDLDRLVRRYDDDRDFDYLMQRLFHRAAEARPDLTWLPQPRPMPRPEDELLDPNLSNDRRLQLEEQLRREQGQRPLRPELRAKPYPPGHPLHKQDK